MSLINVTNLTFAYDGSYENIFENVSFQLDTPVFLPGESQGWGSLVGCDLWRHTELDTTEST